MPEAVLSKDQDFIVTESQNMDLILIIFFLALFIFGIMTVNMKDSHISQYIFSLGFISLLPAIAWRKRLSLPKVAIRINADGIYQYSTLVTNWGNFFDAHIIEKEITGSIQDNFFLVIEYYKDNGETLVVHEIYMSDSFDKSEEQIIAAIKFFSGGEDGPP